MDALKVKSHEFEKTRENIHRQILSAVSHDLKTPLASVIGCLDIFTRMNSKLSEEKKEILIQSALSEAYRLDSFITNILDMAKLESGMVPVRKVQCQMSEVLYDCMIRLGPKGKTSRIQAPDLSQGEGVYTDPMLLGRAIGLLLDNAIKHAGKQSVITIEHGLEGENAFVHVKDTGPGIPQGKEQAIFSKYTRFSKIDQQNAGTGLGLAVCSQIMQLLSGSVSVKNYPGSGAVFTLLFSSRA